MKCRDKLWEMVPDEEKKSIEYMEDLESMVFGTNGKGKKVAKIVQRLLNLDKTGNPEQAFFNWIYNYSGADVASGDIPKVGDLVKMKAEVMKHIDKIDKAAEIAKRGGVKWGWLEWMPLVGVLPQTTNENQLVGLNETFHGAMIDEYRKESTVETANSKTQKIAETIAKITGENFVVKQSELTHAQEVITASRETIKLYANSSDPEDVAERMAAEQRLKTAQGELDNIYKKHGGSKTAILMKGIIDGLENGMLGVDSEATKSATYATALLHKLGINELKVNEITGLANSVDEFFRETWDYAEEAISLAKKNLRSSLELGGVHKDAIEEIMAKIPESEMRKNFFPHRTILNIHAMTGAANEIDSEINAGLATSRNGELVPLTEDVLARVVKGLDETFSYSRTNEGRIDASFDVSVPRVMYHYAAEVANNLAQNRIRNRISRTLETAKMLPIGDENVSRYMGVLLKRIIDLEKHTTRQNQSLRRKVVMAITGLAAAHKLGPFNLPGMVGNWAEGRALSVANAGGLPNAVGIHKDMHGEMGSLIDSVLKSEHPSISAKHEAFGSTAGPTSRMSRLKELFPKKTIDEYMKIESDRPRVNSLIDLMSSTIDKTMGGWWTAAWRYVENGNRENSFTMGAMQEARTIDYLYRHKFFTKHGNVPESIIAQHRLSKTALESGDKAQIQEQWDKFVRDRVAIAGYDFLFNTQWLYHAAARSALEKWSPLDIPIGKALNMFQHYGLSWMNRMYALQRNFSYLNKAAGSKMAWVTTTSALDRVNNRGNALDVVFPVSKMFTTVEQFALEHNQKIAAEHVKKWRETAFINPEALFAMIVATVAGFTAKAGVSLGLDFYGFFNPNALDFALRLKQVVMDDKDVPDAFLRQGNSKPARRTVAD